MRKTRSDSKWDKLTDAQQANLWDWLDTEHLSYEEAVRRAADQFGSAGSVSALCAWRQRYSQAVMLRRIAESSAKANAVVDQFKANPANTYEALLQLIGQATFEAQVQGGTDLNLATLKDLAELTALGLKARHDSAELALKERDLELKKHKLEFDLANDIDKIILAVTEQMRDYPEALALIKSGFTKFREQQSA